MNYDEFAFFNRQLGSMLRDGIPLEEGLKELCRGMKKATLRSEVEALESDLSRGTPLAEALERRKLPEFYRRMVRIGARSDDLASVLTTLADYYARVNSLQTRLKGLMVYPLIVIVVALGLTVGLSFLFGRFLPEVNGVLQTGTGEIPADRMWAVGLWVPPLLLGLATVLVIAAFAIPAWRGWLRWRLPAFREASLAQLASAMALMLRKGTPLADALAMAGSLEGRTSAGRALEHWRALVQAGQGKPADWTGISQPFPPLFLYLVKKGGEDLAAGFQAASDIYQARAAYRIEMALYGALPVSILLLGQIVFWECAPLLRAFLRLMNWLGAIGGS